MRIIILTLLLCFANIITAQTTINYTASTVDFPNPERGFYRHTSTHSNSYTSLNSGTLTGYRNLHSPSSAGYSVYSSLILRVFYLDDFTNTAISTAYLTNLQADFDAIRTAGLKVIVRFAYTNNVDASGCANWICPPYGDASKVQIKAHIDQLKPYLIANSDVIATFQMGFIGVWGEQYYTDYFGDASVQNYWTTTNWDDRLEILNYILDNFPSERMIQVRMPQIKQRLINGSTAPTTSAAMTEAQAHQGTDISRVGFHNDCFLASYTDFGTYNDYGNSGPPITYGHSDTTNLKAYKAADSKFVVVGGETCNAYAPFDNCDSDGGVAETELARFHYSYLNSDYNNTVNDGWVGTCMDDIKKKLGYRFVLQNGTYSDEAQPNQTISVSIDLKNVGYAAPYNERGLELILRNTSDGTKYFAVLTDDARFWFTGSHTITHTLCIPNGVPNGTYDLLLNLPDKKTTLYSNPDYSIQLANTGVWESSTGYNDLGHTITVNSTASNTTCSGEINFEVTSALLPVQLKEFTAKATNQWIECRFETASEINNKGFWLQRSTNAIDFENITWIEGQGNSTEPNTYSFTDKTVKPNQTYYYRLRQVDFDGYAEYSSIVSAIVLNNLKQVAVYPNPIQDILNMEFNNTFSGTLSLFDVMGTMIFNKTIHQQTNFKQNLQTLPKGLYYLIIKDENGQSVQKILKN